MLEKNRRRWSRKSLQERAGLGSLCTVVLLSASNALAHEARPGPLVRVEQGWLRGVSDEERRAAADESSEQNQPGRYRVDEFLGIPFAAPPIGDLRFRPPRAAPSWRGVREAREISVLCAQGNAESTEDCLYLNVFRPRGVRGKLPVLFYIHGGSFMVGSASEYRGRKLASDMPAVVVTTNYRLNVFGFLTLPPEQPSAHDEEAEPGSPGAGLSGNYGLLDQRAALRWVQRNIERFGGDPSRVTISGHSAGASSVCAHLTSPSARGLFSGAIIQSGPCSSAPRGVTDPQGLELAARLGCTDPASAADCLRALPAAELLEGLGDFAANVTIDPELLPLGPREAITAGALAPVPVIIGGTRDEARIYLSSFFPLAPERYPLVLEDYLPGLSAQVSVEYPHEDYDDPVYALSSALNDAFAGCPLRQLAADLSRVTPTYVYEFDDPHAPEPHWMSLPPGYELGSSHSSDGPYLFEREGLTQPDAAPFDRAQLALGKAMRRTLGAFARTGDPSLRSGPYWPEYEPDTDLVLLMAPAGLDVITDYSERHHCDFWGSTLPPAAANP